MGLFAAAAGHADQTIDRVFAGRITVTPMAAVDQYSTTREPDPNRPVFSIEAPIVSKNDVQSIEGSRQEESFIGRIAGGEIWLSVLDTQLAGRELRKGDRVLAHDRPAGDRAFEVAHLGVISSEGRRKFYLTRIAE